MRRSLAVTVIVASSALLLAGCSQRDVAGSIESSPSSSESNRTEPPTAAPTPSETTTVEAPAMPVLAKQQSNAGAKAFIRYYIDVLNHSHRSQTSQLLRSLGTPTCPVCDILAAGIDGIRKAGGVQRGGGWTVTDIRLLPRSDDRHPNYLVDIDVASGSVKRSSEDSRHTIPPSHLRYVFQLGWYQGNWAFSDVLSR